MAAKLDTSPHSIPDRSELTVPDSEIEAVIARQARKVLDIRSPEWQQERLKEISTRKLGWRRLVRRWLSSGRNARQQGEVRSSYEQHWEHKDALTRYVVGLENRTLCVEWRDKGMHLQPQGLRHVHLLYLMRAIEKTGAKSVLEVGFGNGNLLLTLAARFPQVALNGVELTESGLAIAKDMQTSDVLPPEFIAASPAPLLDATAHRRVSLTTGDARSLPFADRSIDLVYTRLALEQMEAIRHKALSEVTRVAARTVVLIEPWRDFNSKEPARSYIHRQGYFAARVKDIEKYGFKVVLASEDIPQKVQFNAGPVIAFRT